jgi:hypothetical protein
MSNGTIVALVTLIALAFFALDIWFVVIAVRYLRWGRKAFERYVQTTSAPARAYSARSPYVGLRSTTEDVAGETLLQRLAGDDLLARVLGVMFGTATAGLGAGLIVAPGLIAGLGVRGALLATGAFLPALLVVAQRLANTGRPR